LIKENLLKSSVTYKSTTLSKATNTCTQNIEKERVVKLSSRYTFVLVSNIQKKHQTQHKKITSEHGME
jgi:hypothetical protein